jgi:hypothetical protein
MKLKSTGFFKPYTDADPRRANLKHTGAGAYLISEERAGKKAIVYVGMASKDVKKTLYRHFQKWTDKRSDWGKKAQIYERVTYVDKNPERYRVKVIFCKTAKEAADLETFFILKFKPRDNTLKLEILTEAQKVKISEAINDAPSYYAGSEEPPF